MLAVTAPLRHPPFRRLVLAATVNRFGSTAASIALAFAVLDLTHRTSALAIVVGARSLANVACLLIGGVLADRLPRSVVLVGSCCVSAASQGVVTVLVADRVDSVTALAVLAAVNGASAAVSQPASAALVPQTVPADLLPGANALNRLGFNIAAVAGPPLGGLLVATAGSAWAIGIDAATFAVAAAAYAGLRLPRSTTRAEDGRPGVLRDLAEGWTAFCSRQWLWSTVAAFTVINAAVVGGETVLGPVLADATFGRPAWGLLLAAQTLGSVAGALLALRIRPRRVLRFALLCCTLLGLPLLALAATASLPLLFPAFALAGAAAELFEVNWQVTMQSNLPSAVLARAYSYDMLGSFLAIPAGQLVASPVAAVLGVHSTLAAGGALAVAAPCVALLGGSVRKLTAVGAEQTR